MCEHCGNITTYAALGKADPTRTSTLRSNFVKDFRRRFTKLKKDIYTSIVTNDCFGLTLQTNEAALPNTFAFNRSADKVDAFMKWFNKQVESGILEVKYMNQVGTAGETPWTNMYIQDSYERGVGRARYEAIKQKFPNVPSVEASGGMRAIMNTPFHVDRLGLLYSRTFTELKGITSAMDGQISRILAQGIADGSSPKILAKKLFQTIGGGLDMETRTKAGLVGRFIPAEQRAATLARTEIIRAHHQATIQEYRNWGIEGVKVQAEWTTAGFDVCDECKSLEGKTFTLDEIEPMIPKHPNCRCLALPQLIETGKTTTKTKQ